MTKRALISCRDGSTIPSQSTQQQGDSPVATTTDNNNNNNVASVIVDSTLLSLSPFFDALMSLAVDNDIDPDDPDMACGNKDDLLLGPFDAPEGIDARSVDDLFLVLDAGRSEKQEQDLYGGNFIWDQKRIDSALQEVVRRNESNDDTVSNDTERKEPIDWARAISILQAADAFGMESILTLLGKAMATLLSKYEPADILGSNQEPITKAERESLNHQYHWL